MNTLNYSSGDIDLHFRRRGQNSLNLASYGVDVEIIQQPETALWIVKAETKAKRGRPELLRSYSGPTTSKKHGDKLGEFGEFDAAVKLALSAAGIADDEEIERLVVGINVWFKPGKGAAC